MSDDTEIEISKKSLNEWESRDVVKRLLMQGRAEEELVVGPQALQPNQ